MHSGILINSNSDAGKVTCSILDARLKNVKYMDTTHEKLNIDRAYVTSVIITDKSATVTLQMNGLETVSIEIQAVFKMGEYLVVTDM